MTLTNEHKFIMVSYQKKNIQVHGLQKKLFDLFSIAKNMKIHKIKKKTNIFSHTHNGLTAAMFARTRKSVSIFSFIVTPLSLPLQFGIIRASFLFIIFSILFRSFLVMMILYVCVCWQIVIHFYIRVLNFDLNFHLRKKMTSACYVI